jgi:hypothetical protein
MGAALFLLGKFFLYGVIIGVVTRLRASDIPMNVPFTGRMKVPFTGTMNVPFPGTKRLRASDIPMKVPFTFRNQQPIRDLCVLCLLLLMCPPLRFVINNLFPKGLQGRSVPAGFPHQKRR